MDCSLPNSSVHGDSTGKNTGVGCHAFLQGIIPNRNWTPVSCIAGRFFTIWATRKAQEYWSGSLSLLQGNFLTQELNRVLLHYRRILYQLSNQRNPKSRSVMYHSLWTHGLYSPWNSPGQNNGMGSFPSPGDLTNPGLNWGLPHCRQILYQLSHQGSPRILEWVAYPFFSGSSWPRNWTGVSCILYQLSAQESPI